MDLQNMLSNSQTVSIFLAVYLGILLIAVLFYVFRAVALFSIGKRRGLKNYGLAWFSIGAGWVLGDIADQYSLIAKGKKSALRYWLLWLYLGAALAYLLGCVALLFTMLSSGMLDTVSSTEDPGTVIAMLLPLLVGGGLAVIALCVWRVLGYIACYRVYRSCAPDSAVVFTVLSILFPVLESIFLFSLRSRDDGMRAPAVSPDALAELQPSDSSSSF